MRLAVGGEEAVAEDEHHEQRGVVEEDPHADHIPGRGVHAPARASGEGEGKGKGGDEGGGGEDLDIWDFSELGKSYKLQIS